MIEITNKDSVFAKPLTTVKAFEFDEEVTRAFDDMISRSVPGYDLLVKMMALYADIFIADNTSVYDLGCSTGVMSRVIAQQLKAENISIYSIDNSQSMIKKCKERHAEYDIQWQCADIETVDIKNASMVVLNLTLQFIKQEQRDALLQKIFNGLNKGGILVLSEKVNYDDSKQQKIMTELYQGFKKVQGYSDLEISQKRAALENVLIPNTPAEHMHRLRKSGFDQVFDCFHCFNFVSYLAIKL
ncbi:MAG: carboxy-S-adenosyl-L-methionine synthase CmoA [Gammaproteobacteria bacterium]|nr:carboxy-S-adenosyl-L-methionine synthase CmoA [Gammaproteobacteria bacterium]